MVTEALGDYGAPYDSVEWDLYSLAQWLYLGTVMFLALGV